MLSANLSSFRGSIGGVNLRILLVKKIINEYKDMGCRIQYNQKENGLIFVIYVAVGRKGFTKPVGHLLFCDFKLFKVEFELVFIN